MTTNDRMMNDRFAAQLRQHLLDNANERPADGQLASVLDAVAVTRQKPSLVARWTWLPGRVGFMPKVALRLAFVAVVLAALLVAGLIIAGGRGGRTTVFEGTWTSTDPGDGSRQTLVVGAGASPTVRYRDDHATGAACLDDEVKVFTAGGDGAIADDRLVVAWPAGGGCGLRTIDMGPGVYAYIKASDQLVDSDGVAWARADDSQPAPTSAPATERAALPAETAVTTPHPTASLPQPCVPAGGRTYTAPIGDVSVTATIPSDATYGWAADSGTLSLMDGCAEAGRIGINVVDVNAVDASSCDGEPFPVSTYADAVAGLGAHRGTGVAAPVDLTIDGHPAVRFDATDLTGCQEGLGLTDGAIIGQSEQGSVYVIDVDGEILTVELNVAEGAPDAEIAEAREIVETLTINKG